MEGLSVEGGVGVGEMGGDCSSLVLEVAGGWKGGDGRGSQGEGRLNRFMLLLSNWFLI